MSLITSLPAAERNGKPKCLVEKSPPKLGTYTSGVVIKKESVTRDIAKVNIPPTRPIL
ncbi:hypothetical protein D3C86_2052420 [compost metagenome]